MHFTKYYKDGPHPSHIWYNVTESHVSWISWCIVYYNLETNKLKSSWDCYLDWFISSFASSAKWQTAEKGSVGVRHAHCNNVKVTHEPMTHNPLHKWRNQMSTRTRYHSCEGGTAEDSVYWFADGHNFTFTTLALNTWQTDFELKGEIEIVLVANLVSIACFW